MTTHHHPDAPPPAPIPTDAQRATLLALLRGEITVAAAAAATGLSRRDLVGWRREHLRSKLPPRDGDLRAPTRRPVTVRWDTWGVPHIRAEQTRDLWVGLGFCMAQERLWQLDYMRRFARGELAAVLGAAALPNDRMLRTLDLVRAAEASLPVLTEEETEALDGIAAGVNAWAEQCQALPLEFDLLGYAPTPWRPIDGVLLWKYRWWTLTGRLEAAAVVAAAERLLPPDLRAAYLTTELAEETIVPLDVAATGAAAGHDTGIGSNNWALAGAKTTTGAPVLCSDPHNFFGNPPQWLEAQLTAPGLDAIGAIYLGTPGIYLGRNRHCAWGVTNHAVSVRDLYAETVDPVDPTRYRAGDAWVPFEVEEQEIAVAGGPAERFTRRRTRRGPIVTDLVPPIDEAGWPPLSMRWVGHEPPAGIGAMLDLQRATSAGEVQAALRRWPCPPLNFVYATTDGHIGYHVAGHVPRRAAPSRAVCPANDPDHEWQGTIPFEALPQLIDPQRGWVATANNPPWPADAAHAPYLALGAWADGYRMRRIRERIDAWPRLAPLEVGAIHGDIVHGRARALAKRIAELLAADDAADLAPVAAALNGWDGAYHTESVAPTLFQAIWETWRDRVAAARLPQPLAAHPEARNQASAVARRLLDSDFPAWWPDPATGAAELRAAARAALTAMTALAGPLLPNALPDAPLRHSGTPALSTRWRWGRFHRVTFPHPLGDRPGLRRLSVGPFATTGGRGTVRAAGHDVGLGFTVNSGSTYRLLADLSASGRAWGIVTTGLSGHPASPHYRDQTRLWLQNRYHPLWMDEADVLAHLEGETRLRPDA
jgi:penicillin amidase